MKILTAAEMRRADEVSSDRFGIPSLELMEHAGHAVARFILREFSQHRRIVVLCGKGNNGGDGFVAARWLAEAGCEVSVVLLADPTEVKGDARAMLHKLSVPPMAMEAAHSAFSQAQLIVDA